jgi:hypothetical protein
MRTRIHDFGTIDANDDLRESQGNCNSSPFESENATAFARARAQTQAARRVMLANIPSSSSEQFAGLL